jgi:hypothetical protein
MSEQIGILQQKLRTYGDTSFKSKDKENQSYNVEKSTSLPNMELKKNVSEVQKFRKTLQTVWYEQHNILITL